MSLKNLLGQRKHAVNTFWKIFGARTSRDIALSQSPGLNHFGKSCFLQRPFPAILINSLVAKEIYCYCWFRYKQMDGLVTQVKRPALFPSGDISFLTFRNLPIECS
ncbi:hypothetical protein NPIL_685001 [Nephila pilipes]|uniref:Uncharacterized protein n=1 Tax=Nephila pilipes TaxID=299642 RepID=A0A8X6PGC2_NEPPI|nr:hypothetical protein NPIL_685001 [Nephila pilipes]